MIKSQVLALRASELREKLNTLSNATEDLTDEQRTEVDTLTTEYRDVEVRLRAAIVSDDDAKAAAGIDGNLDGEGRELRELRAKASVGVIVAAALEHRSINGPEAELQAHFKIGGDEVPLDLLADDVEARVVTSAPANHQVSQRPIVQPIFSMGDAAFLNVRQERLAPGDSVFPTLSTAPDVGVQTDSTSIAETDGSFSADVLQPARVQASFFYRETDAIRFPMMDSALRSALSMGLSEAIDKKLVDQIVADVTRTDATAVDTFATYRSRFIYGGIDGRFSPMESMVKLLVGSATLQDMSVLYRGNNADDSAVDSLRRVSGGLRVSPHIAAVSGNKQDVIVRKGSRADAVIGLWPGVRIIQDLVTKAKTGEIVITARLAAAWKVTRAAGFLRIQSQHS